MTCTHDAAKGGQIEALAEALAAVLPAAKSGWAKQHLDRAGVMQDPPHGWGTFAECEAPWCKRNQDELARWDAILSDTASDWLAVHDAAKDGQIAALVEKFKLGFCSLDRFDTCGDPFCVDARESLGDLSAAASRHNAEVRRLAVEEALNVEQIGRAVANVAEVNAYGSPPTGFRANPTPFEEAYAKQLRAAILATPEGQSK